MAEPTSLELVYEVIEEIRGRGDHTQAAFLHGAVDALYHHDDRTIYVPMDSDESRAYFAAHDAATEFAV